MLKRTAHLSATHCCTHAHQVILRENRIGDLYGCNAIEFNSVPGLFCMVIVLLDDAVVSVDQCNDLAIDLLGKHGNLRDLAPVRHRMSLPSQCAVIFQRNFIIIVNWSNTQHAVGYRDARARE